MRSFSGIAVCAGALLACADDELAALPEEPAAPQSLALIVADPPSYDFGRVPVGESRSTTVTVSNAGNVDVQLESIVFEPAVAFASALLDVVPLAPSEGTPLTVVF